MQKFHPTYRLTYTSAMTGQEIPIKTGLSLDGVCVLKEKEKHDYTYLHIQPDPITWLQFMRIKAHEFLDIPREADMWANFRMTGGPMDTEKFASYVESVGLDNANGVNRLMSRTLTGWYLSEFLQWCTRWNKSAYERGYSDSATDYYIDWREWQRHNPLKYSSEPAQHAYNELSMAEYDADNGSHYAFDSRHDYDGNPHDDYASEDLAHVDRVGGIRYGDHH